MSRKLVVMVVSYSLENKKRFYMRLDSFELGAIILIAVSLVAWFTHIIHCLIYGKYLLLIAGAFIAPVGVIHGVGIWFGVSW